MADAPGSAAGAPAGFNQAAGEFLRWWKQHLLECVPASLRARMAQARRPAMWSAVDDRFWPAAAALDDGKPFSHSALAQRGGGDVALVAGEANGFRRDVELPLAVESRLAQVLGYEIDRLTPLRASELYYDFRVKDRNPAAGVCTVELVAVPRSRVAPMLETARQRNLNVSRLLLAPTDVDTSLDLLAATRTVDETGERYGWVNPALAGLCAVLALALVAVPLWQMRQQVIDLMPVETSARADAEIASAMQRQLEKQIAEYNLPLARKHAAPLAIQVLDDLSKRLPEDTWAQSLEIRSVPNQKTREIVLQGETGSGGKLLQIVQESPLIKDPAFKATMTRVTPTAERFHIAGELVAAELPKPLQLSDAAAVTTVPVAPALPAGAPATAKAAAPAAPATTATSAQPPATAATPGAMPSPAGPGATVPGAAAPDARRPTTTPPTAAAVAAPASPPAAAPATAAEKKQ